jgi:hypothetical protein
MQPNVVENFISAETADYIHNTLKSKAIINPNGLLSVYLTESVLGEQNTIIDSFLFLLVESIANQLGFKKDHVKLNRVNYQILTEGQELGYHSDKNGAYQDTMDNDGYSALLYLNDNYLGGEIVFYDDNTGSLENSTSYHPNSGTLVYFKGDDNYPHSVNKVLSGERANLILFYDVKKEKE